MKMCGISYKDTIFMRSSCIEGHIEAYPREEIGETTSLHWNGTPRADRDRCSRSYYLQLQ